MRSAAVRLACVVVTAMSTVGCRNPLSSPSPSNFLVGRWRGAITIQASASSNAPATIAWTVKNWQAPDQFFVSMQSAHPWWSVDVGIVGSIDSPDQPPANIAIEGPYQSPRGCIGHVRIVGIANTRRIEASVSGNDCPNQVNAAFTGQLTLTKGLIILPLARRVSSLTLQARF